MTSATINEKFRIPALPAAFLARPRLDRVWAEGRERRLLLVTGGAGYGKSSFLAAQARREGRSLSWFTVDEQDTSLPVFAAHLRALLGVEPTAQEDKERLGEGEQAQRLLAGLLGTLRTRGRTLLVLDDAHHLQGSPEVLRFLDNLIRYLPDSATLVIASREPIDLASMRERIGGRASAVLARDLEFRADEVEALFRSRFADARLPSRQYRQILAATEGWAAGLEIFLQALESPLPSAVDRALQQLSTAGSGWFDYFAEEVVSRLGPSTRDFLHRSSILPRLDPAICDQVLDRTDSHEILEDLSRRNLFTQRESNGHGYRYHLLFRTFLRDALGRRLVSKELHDLRRRAARALLKLGDAPGAAELFAEAGETEMTLKVLERHGAALLASERYDSVERALAAIPAARLQRSPEALFLRARLLDYRGRWEEAESVYRRVLKLGPGAAQRVEILSLLGQFLVRRGAYARAFALCRQGLNERPSGSPAARGRLLLGMGVAACELGRLDEGKVYLEKARSLYVRHGDSVGEARTEFMLAANVYAARGEFGPAREAARRALARLREHGDLRRTCQCLSVLAWVTALAGEIEEARDLATEARRLAEGLGLQQPAAMALHVLGRCALHDKDVGRARALAEESKQLGDLLGEADGRILPRLVLIECALVAGDRAAAGAMAGETLILARGVHDDLQQAQCRTLLALAVEDEDAPAARQYRRQAERAFRRLGASFELHRLLLHRLTSTESLGPAGRRLLTELLTGAARLGHDGLFLATEPARAARVLATALRETVEPDYASRLLVRLGARVVAELRSLTGHADDGVRLRAVEILAQVGGTRARSALTRVASGGGSRRSTLIAEQELACAPRVPLHCYALGPLRVSVGDTEIPSERWRSARARRLFQFLLVHRFRWVAADVVIESLWPEADPEKARGNLWQSVHQLRRILEPGREDPRGSQYIRVGDAGYRLEAGEGRSYDVLEFEGLIRDADRLASSRQVRAAESKYHRALELYRGEFLAENPYEEFVVAEREQLRELHQRACVRLVALIATAGRPREVIPVCRRALREDPYEEDLHFHLVQAQLRLGHRREALDAWQAYEARVSGELGLLPSVRMQALAAQMRPAMPKR